MPEFKAPCIPNEALLYEDEVKLDVPNFFFKNMECEAVLIILGQLPEGTAMSHISHNE